jgi:hypothetical protein
MQACAQMTNDKPIFASSLKSVEKRNSNCPHLRMHALADTGRGICVTAAVHHHGLRTCCITLPLLLLLLLLYGRL